MEKSTQKSISVAIVAGEASGDVIGAGLMRELKAQYPNVEFRGIGGHLMEAEVLSSMVDINELSVMGLVEVLKHLPRLLKIKNRVVDEFSQTPPDVYIGIDAPDFNLPIEKKLKQQGVKTVHYVSPTVWAWRQGRIHKIAKATNLVLGLFPFEHAIYDKYQYPYAFVGHTLADEIDLVVDKSAARSDIDIQIDKRLIAVLPGSRRKEIESLLPTFLETMVKFNQRQPCEVIIPAANSMRQQQIQQVLAEYDLEFDVHVTNKPARTAMIAADAVLLASGTASLEAMLCKRPMVVAYKMSGLTYMMMQRLYIPEYFALPNILADELLVPELLQGDVNPDNLCQHLEQQLSRDTEELQSTFTKLHETLRCDADAQAAKQVLKLIGKA